MDLEGKEKKHRPPPPTASKSILSCLVKAQCKNVAREQCLLTDRPALASVFTERQQARNSSVRGITTGLESQVQEEAM